jgi:hypothetical protein
VATPYGIAKMTPDLEFAAVHVRLASTGQMNMIFTSDLEQQQPLACESWAA